MAATRRLQKELGDIRKAGTKSFREIQVRSSSLKGELAESLVIDGGEQCCGSVLWKNEFDLK